MTIILILLLILLLYIYFFLKKVLHSYILLYPLFLLCILNKDIFYNKRLQ